jgi:hypothetical protein
VSPTDIRRLLIVFAVLELLLAGVMLFVFHNVAIGGSQGAIGMSLIAVAAATGKKKSNG